MRVGKRKIKTGNNLNYLFPKASGTDIVIKKSADLGDTIHFIKRSVSEISWQTQKLADFLKVKSLYTTCKNLWEFAHTHFQYKIDKLGYEQVRSPARSWRDRISGIDCDDFSMLIGTTLYNLQIPFKFRLTKYKSTGFEHIYPVALIGNQEVILDAVIDRFNYEVPYTQKKDIIMELHSLNGINAREIIEEVEEENARFTDLPIDAVDLFADDLNGLAGRKERKARQAKRQAKRAKRRAEKGTVKERIKKGIKKGVHFVNKVNPATALLRAGILASMKLNVFKLASKLRFAYWTADEARRKNMDLNKFNQLQRIREKVEKIFHKAGGKPENLKKAILTGKGNRNRMVQLGGLGSIITIPSDEEDLRTVLGEELYSLDFEDESINGLGAIALGSAVAAASGVLATISRLVKKLGGLFKKGTAEAQHDQIQENTDNEEEKQRKFSMRNLFKNMKEKAQERKERREEKRFNQLPQGEENSHPETEFLPTKIEEIEANEEALTDQATTDDFGKSQQGEQSQPPTEPPKEKDEKTGFWAKNWKWIVPVGSTLIVGGTAIGLYLRKQKKIKEAAEKELKAKQAVNGLGAVKKSVKKPPQKTPKKKAVKTSKPKPPKRKTKKPKPRKKTVAVQLIP